MVAAVSSTRALIALTLVVAGMAALAPQASALPRTNPANRLLAVPVDELRYDHAKGCRKNMTKGALALVKWLDRNTGGEYWGGVRCERLGKSSFSMHAEGRAVDWHLDVGDTRDRSEAERLLAMLFSPDRDGNANALARRMGIIEAIWDCRYYGFWMSGGPGKRYSACEDSRGKLRRDVDPTTAHRNHVHFSLSWPGARMRTSYWRYVWLKQPLPDLSDPPFQGRERDLPPAVTPPAVTSPPAPVQEAPAETPPSWEAAEGEAPVEDAERYDDF